MSHIMLDLETWGTKAGSALRSIGAVTFNPYTGDMGDEFYRNIDKQSCLDAGLSIDPGTERWWSEQSKEAQDSLLVDPKPLGEVVRDFATWWIKSRGVQVWSQGSNFDSVLWEAACLAMKARVPWKFFDTRDTRTVYELCGLDTRSVLRDGTYHNALDDAKHQVRCIRAAIRKGLPKAIAVDESEALVA